MSKRSKPRGKQINPHFWVFCEGKTEEAYVTYLRTKYRVPIEIIPKVAGSHVSEWFIQKFKQGKPTHTKDKNFLIYDADVAEVLEKLRSIKTATLIASNPAIELWFLLHYKNVNTHTTTNDCIRELSNRNHNQYTKGKVDNKLMEKLTENCTKACERASNLTLFNNPSSNMNVFIQELELLNVEKNKS
jgi:hypothetical protein